MLFTVKLYSEEAEMYISLTWSSEGGFKRLDDYIVSATSVLSTEELTVHIMHICLR